MELGERIRSLRKQKGLTQEELASRLGLQKSAVAKYENGRVTNITLIPAYRLDRGLSLMPVAAHNDDAKDAEQLRLMEEDLDNM